MQRVKILGGVLQSRQWRGLAEIARRYTRTQRLHLTTRQDIEIHDVTAEQIPSVQRAIADLQLTGIGACGDTLRNITVCPCSGIVSDTVELQPLAWAIRHHLEEWEGIYSLPRKCKISLSCGRRNCSAQPWINDLGFITKHRNGVWGCKVVGAGSLGARPNTAIRLFDWISIEDVPACAKAVLHIFYQLGDRQNRNRARLRHVREHLGDREFTLRIREEFEREKQSPYPEKIHLPESIQSFTEVVRLQFANGDINVEAANALAALADREEFVVRIANQHQVWMFARDVNPLRTILHEYPALHEAAQPQPAIIACPGIRSCNRALTDTNGLANRIRREFTGDKFHNMTVCISGCPNGCAHSAVAPIGLVGVLTKRQDHREQAYNVYVNGGMGRDEALAQLQERKLSCQDVIESIREIQQDIANHKNR